MTQISSPKRNHNAANPACQIRQTDCGHVAVDPICLKCGLGERVRYASEQAGLWAASTAEARYWKAPALGLTAQISQPSTRPPKNDFPHSPRILDQINTIYGLNSKNNTL